MLNHFTLSILKPDVVEKNLAIPIINKIYECNFKIISIKMIEFSTNTAEFFYSCHKEKLFFRSLVQFMSSGPVISMILEKENAIIDFRKLIGNTNPIYAEKNTIRKLYGESIEKNAIHGSDCTKNALKEIFSIFSLHEIFSKTKKKIINDLIK